MLPNCDRASPKARWDPRRRRRPCGPPMGLVSRQTWAVLSGLPKVFTKRYLYRIIRGTNKYPKAPPRNFRISGFLIQLRDGSSFLGPKPSRISFSWCCTFFPGKTGRRANISPRIAPTPQISMAGPYTLPVQSQSASYLQGAWGM